MKNARTHGITLIELLIAVTLVSLLSIGMLFALRVGLNAMDSSNRRIVTNRRATGAQRILNEQLGGFLPVIAKCGLPGNDPGVEAPFFQGLPNVLRFVTNYSIDGAWRGMPVIAELFVIPGENGEGVRLVLNEFPYNGPSGAGFFCLPPQNGQAQFGPPRITARTFVLADKLAFCRFIYQEEPPGTTNRSWVPIWGKGDQWPTAIRVEMASLRADPTRVQPQIVTSRIRITKAPYEPFEF
jgi:general secretion pathway protein J